MTKAATRNTIRTTAAANEDKAAKRTLAVMSRRGTAANTKDLETNAKTNAKDLETSVKTNAKDLEANVKTNAKDLKTNAKNPETSEANQNKKRVYEVLSPNRTPTAWCSRVLGTTVS